MKNKENEKMKEPSYVRHLVGLGLTKENRSGC